MWYHLFTYILFGFILNAFMVPMEDCDPAEYLKSDAQCCPKCSKGTVVRRDCDEDSSTSCVPCVMSTYMDKANGLSQCFPCSSCVAEQGLFTQKECTTTSDSECGVLDGYYCTTYGPVCSSAEKHTHCAPGQRMALGTKKKDTVCEDCQQGYFSQDGVNCTPQTNSACGSQTEDAVCAKASRHHYILYIELSLFLISLIILFSLQAQFPKTVSSRGRVENMKSPVMEVGTREDGEGVYALT